MRASNRIPHCMRLSYRRRALNALIGIAAQQTRSVAAGEDKHKYRHSAATATSTIEQ